jgi:hypothetical protein
MDIPSSMLSDAQPRLIASQVRQVQLPSASGNQQSGGVINFQLSTGVGQGYLKRGSCYLRTTIKLTTSADLRASQGWVLYDTDILTENVPCFGGPLAQASQVINRLTLLSGGSVIEQINNYHIVANVVSAHASSQAYSQADLSMYENSFAGICGTNLDYNPPSTNQTLYITVTIPLMSGLLQSQHHLPLFLLSGNLQIQLDLNPLAVAFAGPASVTAAEFTNNTLIYEQLNVDAVMEATLKQSLMRSPFQIPFNSFVSLAVANASGTQASQPIGLNLSSVYGVLVTEVTSAGQVLVNRKFHVKAGLSSIKCFADGRLVNSHEISTDALFFAEMNKVFNLCFDPLRTSALGHEYATSNANKYAKAQYQNYIFAAGVSMTRVSEDGVVMAGSPVNQMLVELQHSGANQANTIAYYIVPHQLIFTVDIAGVAAVIR